MSASLRRETLALCTADTMYAEDCQLWRQREESFSEIVIQYTYIARIAASIAYCPGREMLNTRWYEAYIE